AIDLENDLLTLREQVAKFARQQESGQISTHVIHELSVSIVDLVDHAVDQGRVHFIGALGYRRGFGDGCNSQDSPLASNRDTRREILELLGALFVVRLPGLAPRATLESPADSGA